MATLNELTYNLRNLPRGGGPLSDDEPISNRQMQFIVRYMRAMLIKREYDKKKNDINPDIVQDMGNVPLVLADPSECVGIDTGCKILRTRDTVPNAVELSDRTLITYVGDVTKTCDFQMITPARAKWMKHGKYTKSLRSSWKLNDYIYISNDTVMEYANIRGVFDDPTEVKTYCVDANGVEQPFTCWDDDMEYPISSYMIPLMNEMILKGELNIAALAPMDEQNDANHAVSPTTTR